MSPQLDRVLSLLPDAKQRGNDWQARCPAHEDRQASLSIAEGRKGVVLTCFAGCEPDSVLTAIGLIFTDLFYAEQNNFTPIPPRTVRQPATPKTAKADSPVYRWTDSDIVVAYDYTDESGKLLYQSLRLKPFIVDGKIEESKPFRQQQFTGKDARGNLTFKSTMSGVRYVLYRLPELLRSVSSGEPIFIPEGEKDADNLAAIGLTATTNIGGAKKWKMEYTEHLRGASRVIILPDNDEPGERHAAVVTEHCHKAGIPVAILRLPDLPAKGDVSDWLAAGGTKDKLLELAEAVPNWTPAITSTTTANSVDSVNLSPNSSIPAPALRTDKDAAEYAPYQIAELLGIKAEAPDTQRALASRATKVYRDSLGYVRELGWVRFDGKRWRTDNKQEAATVAMFCNLSETVKGEAAILFRYVADLIKEDRREHATAMMRAARRHLTHVKQVESERFAAGAMILTQAALDIPRQRFDIKPFVIGFDNGVWDNGTWREHRREDYLLDLSPVSVDPLFDRSEWLAVLDRITGGDTDLQRSIQDMAGYALSGSSTLRFVPWLYGPKGSGKSTIAELLKTALGTMAAVIDSSLLSPDAERGRLGAAIYGKRLAVIAEAGGQRIDGEALKTLSGGDTIPVKFLYKESFDTLPRHMVLLVANDPPTMTAYDEALRDRVSALPCKHALADGDPLTFSEGRRVEDVRTMPGSFLVRGFTAWAIEGLARVQVNRDIYRAPIVEAETRQFWEDTDPLTDFWETQDEAELLAGIGRGELRQRYQTWAAQNCIRKPLSPKVWAEACRVHGLAEEQIGAGPDRGKKIWRLIVRSLSLNLENVTAVTAIDPISSKSRMDSKNVIRDFTEKTSNQGYSGYKSAPITESKFEHPLSENLLEATVNDEKGANDAFYDDPFVDGGEVIEV